MAQGKISWFRLQLNLEPLLKSYAGDTIKKALLAAFEYARTDEIPELGINEKILFDMLKVEVDEAKEEYVARAKKWKRNGG